MSASTPNPPRPHGFFPVLARELRTIVHSPFYLLFMFVFPIGSSAIIWIIFSGMVPREMPVVVRDGDQSKVSRQLVRMIDASPSIAVAAQVQDAPEAAAWIRQGRAYAMIYLPKNLERDIKRRQAPEVSVYFNNQWLLCSGVILRSLRTVTGTLSAGLDIRTRMMKGEVMAEALEHYEPIRVDAHPLYNPFLNYYQFLVPPAIITLMQVFVVMVTVRSVGSELRHGRAGEWLETAGGRPWIALFAKLLPYFLSFTFLIAVAYVLLLRFGRIPNNATFWVLALATVLYVLAYQSMGTLLVVLSGNLRLANSLAGFYTGPAFAYAGITFPLIGIPFAVRIWSYSLPLTHYVHLYMDQAYRGCPAKTNADGLLILMAFVLLPLCIILPRLGRMMRDSKYWGRL